jgi:hypothetical protein
MAKSALVSAVMRGEANKQGLEVPAGVDFDYEAGVWATADGVPVTLPPKGTSAALGLPPAQPALPGGLTPTQLAVGALAGAGLLYFLRK